MGSAIMASISDAFLAKKLDIDGLDMVVSAKTFEHAKNFAIKHNCTALQDNKEVVSGAQYVFIAVKPQGLNELSLDLKGNIASDCVIISMMAGVTIKRLEESFGSSNIIRIMPNIACSVGAALTALCAADGIKQSDIDNVKTLLEASGVVTVTSESLIDAITCVSGSAIAFCFMFAEALGDAAVKLGIKRPDAYKYCAQTMLGAAKMLERGTHPAILKDSVCSPAGTTIEGVAMLEKCGYRGAILSAVDSMYNKCKRM